MDSTATLMARAYAVRLSIKLLFLKFVKQINPEFWWKCAYPPYFQIISFFQNFKLLNIYDFILVFVDMEPYVRKIFKRHIL